MLEPVIVIRRSQWLLRADQLTAGSALHQSENSQHHNRRPHGEESLVPPAGVGKDHADLRLGRESRNNARISTMLITKWKVRAVHSPGK